MSDSLRPLGHQAPPPMGFSRQEYWSGLPFPSPGNLPNPGIEPRSPTLQTDTLPSEPPGKSNTWLISWSKWKVKVKVAQWCLTLCNPMDCNLPGSSVHGILQARILERVAIPRSLLNVSGFLCIIYDCWIGSRTKFSYFIILFSLSFARVFITFWAFRRKVTNAKN